MYHLNQSVSGTEDPWMPLDDWQACEGDPVFRADLRTYAVVRIAHDRRAAAVAIAQRQGERVALRVRSFPDGPLDEGEYLPANALEDHLRDLRRRYPAQVLATYRTTTGGKELTIGRPGPEFAYHGSFFEGSAQTLRAERLVMIDVPSTPERLTPAAETLMSLVTHARWSMTAMPSWRRRSATCALAQRPRAGLPTLLSMSGRTRHAGSSLRRPRCWPCTGR